MKRICTITFNHAHNFGSAFQTYALQQFVRRLDDDIDYRVIDFYTHNQEELYSVFKKKLSFKNLVKNSIALLHFSKLKIKHQKFEDFLRDYISLSPRYYTEYELISNPPIADYYISGSDQIWNVRASDFSDVYYLDFVMEGKKISYAASFGPKTIDWAKYDATHYSELLNKYEHISTREVGSAENVKILTGAQPEIHLDPTFLLADEEWRCIQSDANYNNGKYILLYCLEPSREQLQLAQAIGVKLGLPIVVLRYNNKNDWFNPFVKMYDSGPRDFLSYIDHATLVLSSSFHGTAFSIIYKKPFYVFDGMNDNRISNILTETKLTERSISELSDIQKVGLTPPDKDAIEHFLQKERMRSKEYLSKALDIYGE